MQKTVRINRNLTISQDFFTFLTNSTDYNPIISVLVSNSTNPEVNFVKEGSKPDEISFLPITKNKNDFLFDPWDKKNGRVSMKIGRFVRKIVLEETMKNYEITDQHIEEFVNLYKSWFEPIPYQLKIVSGEELRNWYNQSNYALDRNQQNGSLWKSCMRYQERLKFLDLYVKNTNCKMLVMLVEQNNREVLRSRALLWDDVEVLESNTELGTQKINVMDRIYSTHDSDIYLYKKWAEDNGYIPKWEQNVKSHLFFDIKKEPVKISCKVKLENTKFEYYPYLDTFNLINLNEKFISNCRYSVYWDFKLTQFDGNLEPEEIIEEQDIDF